MRPGDDGFYDDLSRLNNELVNLQRDLAKKNAELREERDHIERLNAELVEALSRVKRLEAIIPICMHCKRVRIEAESWQDLLEYIVAHSDARFSHGICSECLKKHYPDSAFCQEVDPSTSPTP
jgi:hypothetical protein